MKKIPKSLSLVALTFILLTAGVIAATEEDPAFSQAELDQMLAPIALYPDTLLSQILIASTYPLEVVEAARWSENNPNLEGEEAVAAIEDRGWDPSVQALVAFPRVLAHMNEDLQWTRTLGDAFLLQEEQLLDTIQQLRQRAYAAGNLDSMDHLRVDREDDAIIIQPARTRVVYVPYYNTRVIYGAWWWSAYPPVYWAPPPRYHTTTRIVWMSGVPVTPSFFFSTVHWHHRHVIVRVHHHHHHHHTTIVRRPADRVRESDFQRWQHDPVHRRGIAYRNNELNREHGRFTASDSTRRSVPEVGGNRTRFTTWERPDGDRSAANIPSRPVRRDERPDERRTIADTTRSPATETRPAAQPQTRTETQTRIRTPQTRDTSERVRRSLQQRSTTPSAPASRATTRTSSRNTSVSQGSTRLDGPTTRVTPDLSNRGSTTNVNRTVRESQSSVRSESPVNRTTREIQSGTQRTARAQPTPGRVAPQSSSGSSIRQRSVREQSTARQSVTRTTPSTSTSNARAAASRTSEARINSRR